MKKKKFIKTDKISPSTFLRPIISIIVIILHILLINKIKTIEPN